MKNSKLRNQILKKCKKKQIKSHVGWFDSLAGIVKRRFASYVKSHIGENATNRKKNHSDTHKIKNNVQGHHPLYPSSPYHFEKLRATSASMPSSPNFSNRVSSSSHEQFYENELNNTAFNSRSKHRITRHRSPDPPPRYEFLFCSSFIRTIKITNFCFNSMN